MAYTIHPVNAAAGYQWKVRDGLTIIREASLEERLEDLQQTVDKLEQRVKELEKRETEKKAIK
ncbi:MAG TPA: hypothetical protein VE999_05470 [Gemmataceae bacterium]|nr:hypothetical protein [Gemmataceae bacterium]